MNGRARKSGCWALLAIAGAIIVPGCGGGGSQPAVLTPAAIKHCFVEGGAQMRWAPPFAPKGSPLRVPVVYAVGPRSGGIGVVISPNEKVARRLKAYFDERQEWDAAVVRNGKALTLFGPKPNKINRELVAECAIG